MHRPASLGNIISELAESDGGGEGDGIEAPRAPSRHGDNTAGSRAAPRQQQNLFSTSTMNDHGFPSLASLAAVRRTVVQLPFV